jgi:hypothetical protein
VVGEVHHSSLPVPNVLATDGDLSMVRNWNPLPYSDVIHDENGHPVEAPQNESLVLVASVRVA